MVKVEVQYVLSRSAVSNVMQSLDVVAVWANTKKDDLFKENMAAKWKI